MTASLLISGCISQTNNNAGQQNAGGTIPQEKVTVVFSVKGNQTFLQKTIEAEKGINAFEQMKGIMDVNYTMYSFGPMITGINGETAPQNSYWALYIDGNYSMTGINQVILDKNMLIEWRIEQIQAQ